MRWLGVSVPILVAGVMVVSVVALSLLGGGLGFVGDGGPDTDGGGDGEAEITGGEEGADDESLDAIFQGVADFEPTANEEFREVPMDQVDPVANVAPLAQDAENGVGDADDPVEAGVDDGIELARTQGSEVSDEQRAAAIEGAQLAATQHEEADDEQVRETVKGATHGTFVGSQTIEVEQVQATVAGASTGALAQHQTANATQLQAAAWGGAHGAIAQYQMVEVEQLQVAAYGGAAGAASEAGEQEIDEIGKIQEAAQGATYGVLEQYQRVTVEQRQQVTLEHVQHAAAGAAAGAVEGSAELVVEQEQVIEVEQRQEVTIKQVQQAAMGAAKGALVQRQTVSVEQTQAAARGGAKGACEKLQAIEVTQVQKVTVTQVQEAAFGASTGAIVQSQEATVEQIQAAAHGAAGGVLIQHQEVTVTQIQAAAYGASKGAVASAVQYQIVEVRQIQAAAWGAGEGATIQKQVVSVSQVQVLAEGAADGTLSQAQEATVTQIQLAARSAGQETAKLIQYQRISITQLQVLVQESAADTTAYAIQEGIDEEDDLVQFASVDVSQKIEEIEEHEGMATVSTTDQESDGETVVIDSVELSAGGFVAVHTDTVLEADAGTVRGVSGYLEPGEHEDVEIELDEPLEVSQPLYAVAHFDTTSDETFQYVESDGVDDEPYVTEGGAPVLDGAFVALEDEMPDETEVPDEADEPDEPDEPPEPTSELSVADQVGDGTILTVEAATADVDFVLEAVYDDETVESEPFEANETVSDYDLELDPPLEENTTVSVVVLAEDDGEELTSEEIEYTVEPDAPVEPEVEFLDCTAVEVTGDVESIQFTEDFYGVDGFDNVTSIPDVPWDEFADGTTVLQIGDEDGAWVEDDGTRTVQVAGSGAFTGTAEDRTSVLQSIELEENGGYGQAETNPDGESCLQDVRPLLPTLSVEETEPTDDGIDVTFGYENPNENPIAAGGEFVEGETDDDVPAELEPGVQAFTVTWTPVDDEERLVWEIDLTDFGYDEPLSVGTDTAGTIDPTEPADFSISISEVTDPVTAGETLEVTAVVENVGGEADERDIVLSVGDVQVDEQDVSLDAAEDDTVTLSMDTSPLDPGTYPIQVQSEDDESETAVTIEQADVPDEPVEPEEPLEPIDPDEPADPEEPLEPVEPDEPPEPAESPETDESPEDEAGPFDEPDEPIGEPPTDEPGDPIESTDESLSIGSGFGGQPALTTG